MYMLNCGRGYILFREEARARTYVDKTMVIDTLYHYAMEGRKYICVSRPRRFGKTVTANMIAAFFDESVAKESRKLFERFSIASIMAEHDKILQAANDEEDTIGLCWAHQGRHKVIHLNMIDLLTVEIHCYQDFYEQLREFFFQDIKQAYPNLALREKATFPEALMATGDQFIFVIDEWDALFEMDFMTQKDREAYILFLRSLLKDKSYVHFVYMTGILPITKYSSGSSLNMFREFTSFQDAVFYPYFGLTSEEIQILSQERGFLKPSLEELKFWYDGYIRDYDGEHVFNPSSVACALAEGSCHNYWTGTGPMNEVQDMIRHNVKDLRDSIIRMVGGEDLPIELSGFSAEKTKVTTKDEILSAMVVYGFLTYYEKKLRIPNHELLLKFRRALSSEELGLKQTLEESKALLAATLHQQEAEIAHYIEDLHEEKIPFFVYHDENSLSCVIVVAYIAALDDYIISREDKAGKGYVDFAFTPRRKSDPPILLELKMDHSAQNAIDCIKKKNYIKKFTGYSHVLLVGINYSKATKKHTCKTEMMTLS